MPPYRVGIIGCGRPRKAESSTGFGMAHAHAEGYKASPDAKIVSLADIILENAQAFQAEHGGDHIYRDYQEMLQKEALDIVSISTWPHLHAEMVISAAQAGVKQIAYMAQITSSSLSWTWSMRSRRGANPNSQRGKRSRQPS